jgi:hypothetical protein
MEGLEAFGIMPAVRRPRDVVVPQPVVSNRLRCAVLREPDFTYFVFRIEGIHSDVTANWVEKRFADEILQGKEWTKTINFEKKLLFCRPPSPSSSAPVLSKNNKTNYVYFRWHRYRRRLRGGSLSPTSFQTALCLPCLNSYFAVAAGCFISHAGAKERVMMRCVVLVE